MRQGPSTYEKNLKSTSWIKIGEIVNVVGTIRNSRLILTNCSIGRILIPTEILLERYFTICDPKTLAEIEIEILKI